VNKSLPEVGNIHITGIVNVSGFMEYFVLQNTRLSLVMNMAEIISTSIKKACLKMPTLSA
jgi:putative sporulation protein YyaC